MKSHSSLIKKSEGGDDVSMREMLEKAVKQNYIWDIMEWLMLDDERYEKAVDILMEMGFDLDETAPTQEEIKKNEKAMLLGAKLYKYGKSEGVRRYGKTILRKQGIEGDNDPYFDGD